MTNYIKGNTNMTNTTEIRSEMRTEDETINRDYRRETKVIILETDNRKLMQMFIKAAIDIYDCDIFPTGGGLQLNSEHIYTLLMLCPSDVDDSAFEI